MVVLTKVCAGARRVAAAGIDLVPVSGTCYDVAVRIIARRNLVAHAQAHPDSRAALGHWLAIARAARWTSLGEVKATFSKAKACGPDRVRFDLAGGEYRLIVAFDFGRGVGFIKFVGTHAEYDEVDAATMAQF